MQCNPLKPALLLATSLGALHAINLHFHRPSLPTKILPDSVASKPDYSVNAHGAPASRPRASAPPAVPSTASKALGDTAGHTQSAEEAATPFSCANVSVRGLLYDLSALKADWRIASKDSDVEMLVNPCGPLKYENKHCLAGHTGLCLLEKTGGNGVASFGLVSKVLVSPKDELMLTYTSDLFSKDGLPLQGIVKLICDRNASKGPSDLVSRDALFVISWSTPHACKLPVSSVGGPSSWTTSVLSFGLVGLVLYFAIGCIYKSVVLAASGWDALPHAGFWYDAWQTASDLFRSIYARFSGRDPAAGYQQI